MHLLLSEEVFLYVLCEVLALGLGKRHSKVAYIVVGLKAVLLRNV